MKNSKVKRNKTEETKNIALHYFEALADVSRESFLILDANLRIVLANPTFYRNFRVSPKETENRFLYKLGDGQWNIPELRKLLEKILPSKKIVKDYEVQHIFETIGKKTILLNARQIDSAQLIILCLEDITLRKELEEKLAKYTRGLETEVSKQTKQLADRIKELEALNKTMVGRELKMVELKKEMENLKKKVKNGNGNHKNRNGNHKNGNGNHKNSY